MLLNVPVVWLERSELNRVYSSWRCDAGWQTALTSEPPLTAGSMKEQGSRTRVIHLVYLWGGLRFSAFQERFSTAISNKNRQRSSAHTLDFFLLAVRVYCDAILAVLVTTKSADKLEENSLILAFNANGCFKITLLNFVLVFRVLVPSVPSVAFYKLNL